VIRALLVAVGFAAATWMLVLFWMGMAAGASLGLLLGAVAGQSARTPWWLETRFAVSAAAVVFAAQLALTSVTVRRIGRPRPVFGHLPGLLLALVLGPLPFGALGWAHHRAAERRNAELSAQVAEERAEDQRHADQEAETRAARAAREQRYRESGAR